MDGKIGELGRVGLAQAARSDEQLTIRRWSGVAPAGAPGVAYRPKEYASISVASGENRVAFAGMMRATSAAVPTS